MKMNVELYKEIISDIKSYKGLTIFCLKDLKTKFPKVCHDTLWSILSLEYQRTMKQNYTKSDIYVEKCYNIYNCALKNNEPSGIILRIAENENIAPCLIAKLIVMKYLEETRYNNGKESENFVSHTRVNKFLRDTTLIPDSVLAYEVFLCTIYDDQYSPIVESSKGSIGQQYEIQLCRQLKDLNLAYRDESYLRKFGYDKTPDVKLQIPIAVDGFIIHWIESKALFCDEEVHKEYIKNQYSSYWNRFGPGLVIYWFGYIESIDSKSELRFIVRDHVPQNIVTLDPLLTLNHHFEKDSLF